MIKAIIIDDEQVNVDNLTKLIDKFCPNVKLLATGNSVNKAIDLITEFKPDVVFLDVEMPTGSGFTIFEKLPELAVHIIISTAHADYAIKAIKNSVVDYLLKPIDFRELRTAIEKVERLRLAVENKNEAPTKKELPDRISLSTSDGFQVYHPTEIIRFQAHKLNCIVHFENGAKMEVPKCLKDYEALLEQNGFFRIHKSNMVNISHIKRYIKGSGGAVELSDGTQIEVAVRRKKDLLQLIK